jgi:hypothetical protein
MVDSRPAGTERGRDEVPALVQAGRYAEWKHLNDGRVRPSDWEAASACLEALERPAEVAGPEACRSEPRSDEPTAW